MGADFVATGHYAKVHHDQLTDRYSVMKAVDAQKDQSYYLFGLSQEQLKRTIMPLGDLRKIQVRKLAQEMGLLKVAKKPDSQEICFVGSEGYAKFIEKKIGKTAFIAGEFVFDKVAVGAHEGVHHYTVGQKKGLPPDVYKTIQRLGHKGDLFVSGIHLHAGTVFLDIEERLFKNTFIAQEFNWMTGGDFTEDMYVTAKIRSRHEGSPARVRMCGGGRVIIQFEQPQRAITPGQAVVLYKDDIIVGGGWIEKVLEGTPLAQV